MARSTRASSFSTCGTPRPIRPRKSSRHTRRPTSRPRSRPTSPTSPTSPTALPPRAGRRKREPRGAALN
eukprot:6483038-Prymnesium_polylepis.1